MNMFCNIERITKKSVCGMSMIEKRNGAKEEA